MVYLGRKGKQNYRTQAKGQVQVFATNKITIYGSNYFKILNTVIYIDFYFFMVIYTKLID